MYCVFFELHYIDSRCKETCLLIAGSTLVNKSAISCFPSTLRKNKALAAMDAQMMSYSMMLLFFFNVIISPRVLLLLSVDLLLPREFTDPSIFVISKVMKHVVDACSLFQVVQISESIRLGLVSDEESFSQKLVRFSPEGKGLVIMSAGHMYRTPCIPCVLH